ncbi:flagellar biosynthesis protein FlaG [Duganella sp. FT50W]|uniref:Flagellar biosynthesis protein FlaG n=1 Tax=Duganella lactea TaxID=2692173 RepID=A0A6L8MTN1_9BURK|nr:flagellar protein FlaG [Duganella lactea]MYM37175.1 flagellar biosynthesis protein FlaG [Duganella lactea]MYM85407.1 flagellar biosynthesis protein FlaG [Duganella lactea]
MTIDSIGSTTPARGTDRGPASADASAAPSGARPPATAVETANAVKGSAAVPTLAQVNEAVSQLNQSSQAKAQGLEFSVDSDTKRTVVKVVDQSTKEVLRQIPTPEALEIAKALERKSGSAGLLIQQTA